MRKKIIIIGGRTQTRSLAEALLVKGHKVTVISPDESFCERLSEINGLTVIEGDGRLTSVLDDADVNQYDIAITMYDHDADNLVTCQLCKKVYGVKKTISLASDIKRKPLFDEMGIDSVISATDMIASTLEQQTVSHEFSRIVPTTDGRIRISEVGVTKNSPVVGKALSEIKLPKQTIIGCIIRDDQIIVPYGATVISAADNLLIITTAEKENEAVRVIKGN